jgi:hypothetical protein
MYIDIHALTKFLLPYQMPTSKPFCFTLYTAHELFQALAASSITIVKKIKSR